jgi:hypothetical protein
MKGFYMLRITIKILTLCLLFPTVALADEDDYRGYGGQYQPYYPPSVQYVPVQPRFNMPPQGYGYPGQMPYGNYGNGNYGYGNYQGGYQPPYYQDRDYGRDGRGWGYGGYRRHHDDD